MEQALPQPHLIEWRTIPETIQRAQKGLFDLPVASVGSTDHPRHLQLAFCQRPQIFGGRQVLSLRPEQIQMKDQAV